MEKDRMIDQGMKSFYNGFAELLKDQLSNMYDQAMHVADAKIENVKRHAETQYNRLQDSLYEKEYQLDAERTKNQSLALQLEDKGKMVDAIPLLKNAILPFMEQLLLNIHLAEDGGEADSLFFEDLKNTVEQFLVQDVNMNSSGFKVIYSEHRFKGKLVDTQSFEVVPKETFDRAKDGTFYRTLRPGLNINGKPLIYEKVEILKYRGGDGTYERNPETREEKQYDDRSSEASTKYDEPAETTQKNLSPTPEINREENASPKKDDEAPVSKKEEAPLEYGYGGDGYNYRKITFADNREVRVNLSNMDRLYIATRRAGSDWKTLFFIKLNNQPHAFGGSYYAYFYLENGDPYIDVYCGNTKNYSANLKEIDR